MAIKRPVQVSSCADTYYLGHHVEFTACLVDDDMVTGEELMNRGLEVGYGVSVSRRMECSPTRGVCARGGVVRCVLV